MHQGGILQRFMYPTRDCVLQKFANLVAQRVRQSDILGRWGSEKFITLLCPPTHRYALDKGRLNRAEFLGLSTVRSVHCL